MYRSVLIYNVKMIENIINAWFDVGAIYRYYFVIIIVLNPYLLSYGVFFIYIFWYSVNSNYLIM